MSGATRRSWAIAGVVIVSPTAEIAPADKFLYALRDATATVESIPLIAASIMSKKMSEGIDGLVLDVKTGDGAFMEEREDSVHLATTMCEIGRAMGKNVVALITRMDQPLGRAVGNAVEVAESVECLRGEGPPDLTDLSIELAAEMVVLAGQTRSLEQARLLCRQAVAEGRALERFRSMVDRPGRQSRFHRRSHPPARAARRVDLPSPSSGIVQRLAARPIGHATMLLGAGRARVDSSIDPAVGVILHKKVGDPVAEGEPLCTLLVNDESRLARVSELDRGCVHNRG